MEPVIYFDIDRTLFDAVKFKGLIQKEITTKFGVPDNVYEDFALDYIASLAESNDFNLNDYIRYLGTNLKLSVEKLEEIYAQESLYKQSLYTDVIQVLENLSKDYKLGIFSQGYPEYQMLKLEKSGIYKYFSKDFIVIERRKLESQVFKKMNREGAIIDDKPEVMDRIFAESKLTPIWLNRLSPYELPGFKTIHSLDQLADILY